MNPVVIYSVATLSAVAAVAATVLYFVAKKFQVKEDPRIDEVDEVLPGANCGGCGFPGCRGFAEGLVKSVDENGNIEGFYCPVGGAEVMEKVASILGVEAGAAEPVIAVVRCNGTHEKAPSKVKYEGPQSCQVAHLLYAGENGCPYGCLGLGDCVAACPFDAIHMDPETGLPVVDAEKCTGCGECARACPRGIIEMRPRNKKGKMERRIYVACVNKQSGADAMKNCKAACIGCEKCYDVCPVKPDAAQEEKGVVKPDKAISLMRGPDGRTVLAYIIPEKCTTCGLCADVCPTGAILATFPTPKKLKEAAAKKRAEAEKKKEAAKEPVKEEAKA